MTLQSEKRACQELFFQNCAIFFFKKNFYRHKSRLVAWQVPFFANFAYKFRASGLERRVRAFSGWPKTLSGLRVSGLGPGPNTSLIGYFPTKCKGEQKPGCYNFFSPFHFFCQIDAFLKLPGLCVLTWKRSRETKETLSPFDLSLCCHVQFYCVTPVTRDFHTWA